MLFKEQNRKVFSIIVIYLVILSLLPVPAVSLKTPITCTFDPLCSPTTQECGSCAYQTRSTLCNGGCSAWSECTNFKIYDTQPSGFTDGCYGGEYRDYFCTGSNANESYRILSTDSDNDGYSLECGGDCNDNDFNVHPDAVETPGNGKDDDCNPSTLDTLDNDKDGFDSVSDCNDNDKNIYPGAEEICNGVDDDCDNQIDENVKYIFYLDSDSDNFGNPLKTTEGCIKPEGYVTNSLDCDDYNSNTSPNAIETCNNIDDNCNYIVDEGVKTTFYRDFDNDSFGNQAIFYDGCSPETGYVLEKTDCDDNNNQINPSIQELCNGINDDCDTQVDEDFLLLNTKCGENGFYVCTQDQKGVICSDDSSPKVEILNLQNFSYNINTVTILINTSEDATCRLGQIDASYENLLMEFNVTGSKTHSHTLTELNDNDYTFYIRCSDTAQNKNTVSSKYSFSVDTIRPTVEIFSLQSNKTNNDTLTLNIKFSEQVNDFNSSKINLTNALISSFIEQDKSDYIVIITPQNNGEVTLNVPEASCFDLASNPNKESISYYIIYDTLRPSLTISTDSTSITNNSVIPITLTSDKELYGFDNNDIAVTNGNVTEFIEVNKKTFMFNVTPLNPGNVEVSIPENSSTDLIGNKNFASNRINIIFDNVPPYFIETLSNQTVEYNNAFTYVALASDNINLLSYSIDNDKFSIDNGTITNLSSLSIGHYPITITISDSAGNKHTQTIELNVIDTTKPVWAIKPVNASNAFKTAFRQDISASDLNTIAYSMTGSEYFNINETTGVITNIGLVPVGVYSLNITAKDAYNNSIYELISIDIFDSEYPVFIEQLQNLSIEYGLALTYDINATDNDAIKSYEVNDILNFAVDQNGILSSKQILPVGNYDITLTVTDSSDNILTGDFTISVIDTTAPNWIREPQNATFEYNTSYSQQVNATDLSPISYSLIGTSDFSISNSGLIENITTPVLGQYTFTVVASDVYGNNISKEITLTINDVHAPVFTETQVNQTIEFGNQFSYDVNATDNYLVDKYSITDNENFTVNQSTGSITNNTYLQVGVYPITVSVNDTSNNIVSAQFNVTVVDTIAPTWDIEPQNATFEYNNSYSQQVNATDLSPVSYLLIGTSDFSISSAGLIENITTQTLGQYAFTVVASDVYGNNISKEITLTVNDIHAPVFIETPVNQTIEFGTQFSYDVNATDNYQVDKYSINDSVNFNIDAVTGLITNNTYLEVGVYPVTVSVNDTSNNINNAAFNIIISDGSKPVWNIEPQNATFEYNNSYSQQVNATDLSPISYSLTGTSDFSISSTGLVENITTQILGQYTFTVIASDVYGNNISKEITLTVNDIHAPVFTETPVNQTIEFGTQFSYDINATDNYLVDKYVIDNSNFTINPSTGLITNNTSLQVGVYPITVSVNDTSNNIGSTQFNVTVVDTIAPTWDIEPQNATFEYNNSYSQQVNATDLSPISYSLIGTSDFSISSTGLIENITTQILGQYTFTVIASDVYGNNISKEITLTINDVHAPVFTETPVNQTIEFGTAFNYDINATDNYLVDKYSINDSVNFNIDAVTGLITNNTYLQVGVYQITVSANDTSNNIVSAQFDLTVSDGSKPIWDIEPQNGTFEYNTSYSQQVNATDLSPVSYSLIGTSDFSISSTGLIENITTQILGQYTFTVIASDSYGNNISKEITLTVNDIHAPVFIETPVNQTIEFGTQFSYDVNATDNYQVDKYSIDNSNFTINPSTGLITNNTYLQVGVYPVTVSVNDTSNNIVSAQFNVTVVDTIVPTWDIEPQNATFEYNTSYSQQVNATDLSPISYSLTGTNDFSISSTGLIENITTPILGQYTFIVIASDSYGNNISKEITLTVNDVHAPVFIETPVNQTVEFGTQFNYDVNATDNHLVDKYSITDNENFTVNSSTGLIANITDLQVGVYPITISVNDTSNNIVSAQFNVFVVDTTKPQVSILELSPVIEYGTDITIKTRVTDLSLNLSEVTITIDSIQYNMNLENSIDVFNFTLTSPLLGTHNVTFNASDTEGNYNDSVTAEFSVTDTTKPRLTIEQLESTVEYGLNTIVKVDVEDLSRNDSDVKIIIDGISYSMILGTDQLFNYTIMSPALGVHNITFNATDTQGNFNDSVISQIDVVDTTKPSVNSLDYDTNIEFGENAVFRVNVTDLNRDNSNIKIMIDGNNSPMNFESDDIFNYTLTAPTLGLHNIRINATDSEGNYNDSVIGQFNVTDTIKPQVFSAIVPSNIEFGENVIIKVNVTDLNRNDSDVKAIIDGTSHNMNLIEGDQFNYSSKSYGVGEHTVIFNATDTQGNYNDSVYATFNITDTIAPTWEIEPQNATFEYNTSYSQQVNTTDLSPVSYSLTGTSDFSISSTGLIENITTQTLGQHTFTVIASDSYGNNISKEITLTINDVHAPVFTETPVNQTIEFGTQFSYDVNATDNYLVDKYVIDNSNFTINPSTGSITNNTYLQVGVYPITVSVNDTSNNIVSAQFNVTVVDTIAPTWDIEPQNGTFEYNTSYSQQVNATDLSPVSYSLVGTSDFSISSTGLIENITTQILGQYTFTVIASDVYGNNISKEITLTVNDIHAPVFTETPVNQTIEFGTQFSYDVNATDNYLIDKYVIDNSNFTINPSTGLITNNTYLQVGVYPITVSVNDTSNNMVSAQFNVTVVDSIAPTWDIEPQNATFEYNTSYSQQVNATDLSTVSYSLTGTSDFSISSTGLIENITTQILGQYTFTVIASDVYGNNISKEITLTVNDIHAPVFTETPVNQTVEFGTAFNYDINATDNYLVDKYAIDNSNFTINPSTGLITNNTYLQVGVYPITVSVNDTSNNIVSAQFNVTVIDTIAPTWDIEPQNGTFEYNTSYSQQVNATDLSPVSYSLTGTSDFSISSAGLIENISAVTVGVKTFNVIALDSYGNNISKQISITVTDTQNPVFAEVPINQTVEFGTQFSYDVNATDNYLVDKYVIDNSNFTINQSTGLITNNTYLQVGVYPITVSVNDTSNNVLTGQFNVTVIDTIAPTWDIEPQNATFEYNTSYSQQVNASDLSTVSYSLTGTSDFSISSTGLIENITTQILGQYTFTVIASDTYGNNISKEITLTVNDIHAPVFTETPVNQTIEFGTQFSYDVNATDNYLVDKYVIDNSNFTINPSTGLITNNTYLQVGVYPITVSVNDTSNNIGSTQFNVTVVDTIAPTWDIEPQNATFEYNASYSQQVNATDLSPVSYSLIGTSDFSISSTGLIENITTQILGQYTFTVIASDVYGNNISKEITLTVNDVHAPVFIETPVNQTIEFGTQFSYDVNATDNYLVDEYVIDNSNFTINPSTGLVTNNTYLQVGLYQIIVSVNDTSNNILAGQFNVTVIDTIAPTWDIEPQNATFEYNTSYSQQVNATDLSPVSYSLTGTSDFSISSAGLIENITTQTLGQYTFIVIASDVYGNNISKEITLTVNDVHAPVFIETPVNQTIEFGTQFSYDVNATDNYLVDKYVIDNSNFTINQSTGLVTNNTYLQVGVYPITISVNDTSNNVLTGQFNVIVIDTIAPTWDIEPQNATFEYNASYSQQVNATDLSPVSYSLIGTSDFSISSTGLIENISAVTVGVKTFNVIAVDTYGNNITKQISITVTDTQNPVFTQTPVNQIIEFGTQFNYDINATDNYLIDKYVIDNSNFTINPSTGLVTNNTYLQVGVYPITISVNDTSNNMVSAQFNVTVVDTIAPTWDIEPQNATFEYNTSYSQQVNATDLSTVSYSLVGTNDFSISSTGLIENITTQTLGQYTFTVIASDVYGNNISKDITLTINDVHAPVFTQTPVNQTIEFGTQFGYDVNATDNYLVDKYVIDNSNFTINPSTGLITNNTYLQVGNYPITVSVNDTSNNVLTGQFNVIVIDTIAPTWDIEPKNATFEYNTSYSQQVNATDLSPVSYSLTGTSDFSISSTGLIENISAAKVGLKTFNVIALDSYGNNISKQISITVTDTQNPVFAQTPVNQPIEFGTAFNYDINATDNYLVDKYVIDNSNFTINPNTGLITNNTYLQVGVYPITVSVNDTSNNIVSAQFNVTVVDTIAPTWDIEPQNATFEYNTSYSQQVNATDLSPVSYSLIGTSDFSISSTGLIENITTQTLGQYTFTVIASDVYGNNISKDITLTINDIHAPVFTQTPVNQTIEFGTQFGYDVNATDNYLVDKYVIDNSNFTINPSTGLITNNTYLQVGNYPITVSVNDTSNNIVSAQFNVTVVDTIAPIWDIEPQNATFEYNTSYSQQVNATDLSPLSYSLIGTSDFSTSSTGLIENISAVTVGVKTFNVIAVDTYGNNITKQISITVTDTQNPVFAQTPVNQTTEFGTQFNYDINATDNYLIDKYVIDNSNFTINPSTGLITNNTYLQVGVYPITVSVNDTSNNMVSAQFNVTVVDTIAPTWDIEPQNATFEYNTSYSQQVNATDLSPVSYTLSGTSDFSISSTGLIENITTQTLGQYTFTVIASDSYGNNISKEITLTINDIHAPVFTETPVNQTIEFGDAFSYDVNATDNYLVDKYSITDNENFTVNQSTGLITNNTYLQVGVYPITVSVNDTSNNIVSAQFNVTVVDTIAPIWDIEPQNATFEYNTSYSQQVNATDLSPVSYSLTGTSDFSISSTGLIENITTQILGQYTFTVVASDSYGNNISKEITLTVNDIHAPAFIETPVNQTIEFGTAFNYDVNATDNYLVDKYSIDNSNFTINPSTGLITNNTYLQVGVYPIIVSVNDTSNNILAGQFNVTVIDTIAPTWEIEPQNATFEYNTSYSQQVNATDLSPISYSLTGTSDFSISSTGLIENITTPVLGEYTFTVVASDVYGNSISKEITLTVNDIHAPVFTETPVNQTVEFGTPFSYDINATDNYQVDKYVIDNSNFTINQSTGLITNNTYLQVGVYPITVSVNDTSNNIVSAQFNVTVVDSIAPTWDIEPQNATFEYNNPYSQQVDATDLSTVLYSLTGTSDFSISSTGLIENITTPILGQYTFTVIASDVYGNNISKEITLTVNDIHAPVFTETPVNQTTEFGTQFSYDVNATDNYLVDKYSISDNENFTVNQSTGLITNNTYLQVGVYPITVSVNDTSNNILAGQINVTVIDTIAPTWDIEPQNATFEYNNPYSQQVNATDLSPVSYSLVGTSDFSISSTGLIENITTQTLGQYTFTVIASDVYGNNISKEITLTVNDIHAPVFIETPVNQTVEFGTQFNYDVNATDNYLVDKYVIDNSNFTINPSTGLITNNTYLEVGVYPVTVSVNDTSNNMVSAQFNVTVVDTIAPTWDIEPQNATFEYNTSYSQQVNATDLSPVSYSLTGTSDFSISSTGLIENITTQILGQYTFTVVASDSYGNNISKEITLTVNDIHAPVFTETPVNQTLEFGTQFSYDVNATDNYLVDKYSIDNSNFTINPSTGLITNNTYLQVGVYPITVSVNDTSNNILAGQFNVTVIDTIAPTWDIEPQNATFEYNTSYSQQVNASDLSTVSYSLIGTSDFSISSTGLIENITTQTLGQYTFTVIASDSYGNNISKEITLTVNDIHAPVFTETPVNQTVEFGTPFNYDINATDNYQFDKYVIDNSNFTISPSTGLITNNTYLQVGVYPIIVSVNDTSNNVLTGQFNVIVIDTISPTWDIEPQNATFEYNNPYSQQVNATDLSPVSYSLTGTSDFSISSTGLIENITTPILGQYTFSVVASDVYGNNISKEITLTVNDIHAPVFTETPVNQTVEFGTAFNYDINATDNYQVDRYYINDNANFTINQNTGLITNNTYLQVGVYPITVSVNDTSNNIVSEQFNVSIIDTNKPVWNIEPQNATFEYNNSYSQQVNATDLSPVSYSLIGTSDFSISSAGLIENITTQTLGQYTFTVIASDSYGNNISKEITLTVNDLHAPVFTETPVNQTIEFGTAFNYDVNATDNYLVDKYSITDNENFTVNQSTGLITNNTYLQVGVYPITVSVNDTSNNKVIAQFNITVSDGSKPAWHIEPQNATFEYNNSYSQQVNATDLSPVSYSLIGTSDFSISSTGLIENITTQILGQYTFTVIALDVYGNNISKEITLTVNDIHAPVFIETPVNQTVEFGTPFSYDINATDNYQVDKYVIDNSNFTINPSTGLITNNTDLQVGVYPVTVSVTDLSENIIVAQFNVNVVDTTTPELTILNIENITYTENEKLKLKAVDYSEIISVTATVNGTVYAMSYIGNNEYETNLTMLGAGSYVVEFKAIDKENNENTISSAFIVYKKTPVLSLLFNGFNGNISVGQNDEIEILSQSDSEVNITLTDNEIALYSNKYYINKTVSYTKAGNHTITATVNEDSNYNTVNMSAMISVAQTIFHDIEVSEFEVPYKMKINSNVLVNVSVKNTGTVSESSILKVYLNGTLKNESIVNAIAPNETQIFSLSILAPSIDGTNFELKAVLNNVTEETDILDNTAIKYVEATAVHDIIVNNIVTSKDTNKTIYVNDSVEVSAQITNNGEINEENIEIKLIDQNGGVHESEPQYINLSVGETKEVTFIFKPITKDYHTLSIKANTVKGESDATNNMVSKQVRVWSISDVLDLSVFNAITQYSSYDLGTQFLMKTRLQNKLSTQEFYDIKISAVLPQGITAVDNSEKYFNLTPGEFKLASFTLASTAPGTFNVTVSSGNNEYIGGSKTITIN